MAKGVSTREEKPGDWWCDPQKPRLAYVVLVTDHCRVDPAGRCVDALVSAGAAVHSVAGSCCAALGWCSLAASPSHGCVAGHHVSSCLVAHCRCRVLSGIIRSLRTPWCDSAGTPQVDGASGHVSVRLDLCEIGRPSAYPQLGAVWCERRRHGGMHCSLSAVTPGCDRTHRIAGSCTGRARRRWTALCLLQLSQRAGWLSHPAHLHWCRSVRLRSRRPGAPAGAGWYHCTDEC